MRKIELVTALVLRHCWKFAFQICLEFGRFSTYMPACRVAVFYGGVEFEIHKELLKNGGSNIVVGTPGKSLIQARGKDVALKNVRHVIHDEQLMISSATISKEILPVCKKFMQEVCPVSSYDWSKGAENHNPAAAKNYIFLHLPQESEVKGKPRVRNTGRK